MKPTFDLVALEIARIWEANPVYKPMDFVVTMLSEMDEKETQEVLLQYARDANTEKATWGLNHLLAIAPQVGFEFIRAKNDTRSEWLYCYKSLQLHAIQNVADVCQILMESQVENNRYMAAMTLLEIGNRSILPILRKSLHDRGQDFEGRKICDVIEEAIQKFQQDESEE